MISPRPVCQRFNVGFLFLQYCLMMLCKRFRLGPAMRRGVADLNGDGEVVGGIVIMRSGENALATIDAVKQKLQDIACQSCQKGIELIETYDRSDTDQQCSRNADRSFVGRIYSHNI